VASIVSLLPKDRIVFRCELDSFGGTRTTRSPWAISNCSRVPL
jgi:hypothetical protein